MSLGTFTVFQDSPSSGPLRAKVLRPNVMTTRSLPQNVMSPTGATVLTTDPDKENYDPVTGERAGPGTTTGKKRKTGVLVTKVQPPTDTNKLPKENSSQPEKKKRKPSPPFASAEPKISKKSLKSSVSTRKGTKRTGSRKVSQMPKLKEADEVDKSPMSQQEIDSRCKELTLKPLADVSEAYDEFTVLCPLSSTKESKLGPCTVKAPSVEPEIRDYFEPSGSLFASTSASRRGALSDNAPEPRTFSTPERKQIYAAFTFSSPSGPSTLFDNSSNFGDVSSPSPDLV